MEAFRDQTKNSIMEAVNRDCPSVQENHDWISEFFLAVQDNQILGKLNHDIDVQCILQWRLLWCSGAQRFEQRFAER